MPSLRKFPSFVERRIHNFNYLKEALKGTEDKLILPEACENSETELVWFPDHLQGRRGQKSTGTEDRSKRCTDPYAVCRKPDQDIRALTRCVRPERATV